MQDKQIDIKEYITHKKNTYDKLLGFIDNDNDFEESYKVFISYFDAEKKQVTNQEFKEFLQLLSKVTKHHHRELDFVNKIEKIISYFQREIKNLSNSEIFNIFKNNKLVLLLLFDMKIIEMDTNIFHYFNCKKNSNYLQYFYPECKELIHVDEQKTIYKEMLNIDLNIFDNFEEKRKTGENESYICSLIRRDSIDDFIIFVKQTNLPLNSIIKQSIFETNPYLIKSEKVSLIEYASFFGSIRIVKYLFLNNVTVDDSEQLVLNGIHSNNAELIQIFEDNKIISDDYSSYLLEAVACHHNEIANHFIDKYLSEKAFDMNHLEVFYHYNNYYCFHDDVPDLYTFYYLCRYQYYSICDLYIKMKEKYFKTFFNESKIKQAADENLVDVVYYLLSKRNKIRDLLFKEDIPNALYQPTIIRIAIPPSIDAIGCKAFVNCINLEQVSLPPSLISINQFAFLNCKSLTHVSIPDSIKSIGSYSFKECTSLIQIKIPPSITVIEEGTFYGCTSLTTVMLPSSIVSIKSLAFCNCSSLENISIPSSVTSIGEYAFSDCVKLIEFEIPPLLTSIDEGTFNRCVSLNNITIPTSIQSIGIGAFSECYAFTHIEIPNSITLLDNFTFNRCTSLTQITISNQIKTIGRGCFAGCHSLLQIELPNTLEEIMPFAFCSNFLIKQISIPSSMISIGDYAFSDCVELNQINIHSSVKFIGKNTFQSCPILLDLTIPSTIQIVVDNQNFQKRYPRIAIYYEPVDLKSILNDSFDDISVY